MKSGPLRYAKAAFNARPLGMFVAPNWILLGVFALLGVLNWGFWVLGAGLELAYLFALTNSARFQRLVDSEEATRRLAPARARVDEVLSKLGYDDQARYGRLRGRCERLLHDPQGDEAALAVQKGALDRLLWMYLQLLRTRGALDALLREAEGRGEGEAALLRKAKGISEQQERADAELGRSLAAQADLLRQRAARQVEARTKLAQVEAELARIEHQVELIREDAVVTAEPGAVRLRIDAVTAGLNETMSWVRSQPDLGTADMLDETPELLEAEAEARAEARR
ncbi:hypothetical protein [Chondromyces apiculatus]|uniref:Uncharacterized protein n=1 Tax=Chondromyces apiculatus DSM 436 TaxID=1192034 RepID=A0A017T061_9BACT|nr:hypothetical protein [Chondromyces apiculatus]EYF02583.1 Hypothetical protein CAP_6791 [Chondromyces apiculatus DSM 436]